MLDLDLEFLIQGEQEKREFWLRIILSQEKREEELDLE